MLDGHPATPVGTHGRTMETEQSFTAWAGGSDTETFVDAIYTLENIMQAYREKKKYKVSVKRTVTVEDETPFEFDSKLRRGEIMNLTYSLKMDWFAFKAAQGNEEVRQDILEHFTERLGSLIDSVIVVSDDR